MSGTGKPGMVLSMYAVDSALIATPLGPIRLTGTDKVVERIELLTDDEIATHDPSGAALRAACAQLSDYFAGEAIVFDLPLVEARTPRGGVLRAAIAAIPSGSTASYGAVARSIASSARAVGQACARNPYPIVIPCHRVLGTGGVLGPYSAGAGPVTKAWLLNHECRS